MKPIFSKLKSLLSGNSHQSYGPNDHVKAFGPTLNKSLYSESFMASQGAFSHFIIK